MQMNGKQQQGAENAALLIRSVAPSLAGNQ